MKNKDDKVNQSPTADAVFEAIHKVMHLYRSQRLVSFKSEGQDITHMESRVLDYFAHHPDSTLSDLMHHSGRDKAQLTRLIRGLREGGLLDAVEDPTDRRIMRLRLSQQGSVLQRQLRQQGAHVLEKAVTGLSPSQCSELVALLQIVRGNLERE